MRSQTCFIRPVNGEWIQLDNCAINVLITRRLTRTVIHGGEGDDLIDEGAESAVYTVKGEIDLDTYKEVVKIFRSGQPYFHEPYEEREIKVVFSRLEFNGETDEFTFEFIEDIQ